MNFEDILMEYKIKEIGPLVKGSPILDIGCVDGRLLNGFGRRWMHLSGIDVDPEKIERAKELYPKVIFHACDFFEWNAEGKHYRTVISTNVIEHVDNPMAFLRRCHDLLDDWGQLILTTPNAFAMHKLVGAQMGYPLFELTDADREKGHKHVFSGDILRVMMEQIGFKAVTVSGILLKPLPSSMMAELPREMIDAFYEVGKAYPKLCSNLLVTGAKS